MIIDILKNIFQTLKANDYKQLYIYSLKYNDNDIKYNEKNDSNTIIQNEDNKISNPNNSDNMNNNINIINSNMKNPNMVNQKKEIDSLLMENENFDKENNINNQSIFEQKEESKTSSSFTRENQNETKNYSEIKYFDENKESNEYKNEIKLYENIDTFSNSNKNNKLYNNFNTLYKINLSLSIAHAGATFIMNALLYYNYDLYDLFLCDIDNLLWYVINIIICIVPIIEINDAIEGKKIAFWLYFIYFIIFILASTFIIFGNTISFPFYFLLLLININILIGFDSNITLTKKIKTN